MTEEQEALNKEQLTREYPFILSDKISILEMILKLTFIVDPKKEGQIKNMTISHQEGFQYLKRLHAYFRDMLSQETFDTILVPQMLKWLCTRSSQDSLIIFCQFLEEALNEEEMRFFLKRVQNSNAIGLVQDRNHLLFQLGGPNFGYCNPY